VVALSPFCKRPATTITFDVVQVGGKIRWEGSPDSFEGFGDARKFKNTMHPVSLRCFRDDSKAAVVSSWGFMLVKEFAL
jgi:hypothetical protein